MAALVAPSQALTIADEGVRLKRITRVLFAIVWFVPGLLGAIQLTVLGDASGAHYGFGTAVAWQIATWLIWSIWSQAILTLVDRVPLGAGRFGAWIALHVVASALVCAADVLAIAALDRCFAMRDVAQSFGVTVRQVLVGNLAFQVVLYWAVLGAAYMVSLSVDIASVIAPLLRSNKSWRRHNWMRCGCN